MHRFLRNNGLSLVMLGLFLFFWVGQLLTGWAVHNEERKEDGEPPLTWSAYLVSSHALEATAENWESEFLQMAAFTAFTALLFQRGSAESRDPAAPAEAAPARIPADAPWPVRRGGWVLRLYAHSLSLSLLGLFAVSFVLHVKGGAGVFNQERLQHGEPAIGLWAFLCTPQFWFQSLQNWQSEFLSIGAMVVLSIFFRERNSPESKRVETPHHAHDD